jgi:CheY-like chemotaxis protein
MSVLLNARSPEKPMVTPDRSVPPGLAPDAPSDRLRLMIVDSYPDCAESFARLIRIWGHEARACQTGDEALVIAETFRPDAVLMEVRIDGMDGFELARKFRQNARFPGITLVAVTGRVDGACRHRCQEATFDVFLPKPVEPCDLQELLTHIPPGSAKAKPPADDGPSVAGGGHLTRASGRNSPLLVGAVG